MRSPGVLDQLKSEDFNHSIGFLHTPATVRRKLQKCSYVRRMAAALRFGSVTEMMVREFVSAIMEGYSRGRRLPNDLALAALAVMMEIRTTDFAEEYLIDLARLRLPEMSTSIHVARECLKYRYAVPKHQAKSFALPSNEKPPTRFFVSKQRQWRDTRSPGRTYRYSGFVEPV
jgi:hypothetical protein